MPIKDPAAKLAYDRAWRARHALKLRAYNRAYRTANAAKLAAQHRAAYEAKKEERRAKNRANYALNKVARQARNKIYRETHTELIRLLNEAYRKANPDKRQANQVRRRAMKKGSIHNDLSAAQWREIKEHYGHRCVYCGRAMQRLTQDHIIPLVKGGFHTFSNVVPACQTCNVKKNINPPPIPVQPLLFTLAPARPYRQRKIAS